MFKNAKYGRMHDSRCITGEYTHTMGCYADVISYLEDACAGKQECAFLVGTLDQFAQPCDKNFKAYLEVQYSCVPGGWHV